MSPSFFTYADLRAEGMTRSAIRRSLGDGRLIRVRRDRYVDAVIPETFQHALAHGGQLDCVSLLSHLGVFVAYPRGLHVRIERGASRLPLPSSGVVRHWRNSEARRSSLAADLVEALAQACRCQAPTAAIASLDSAINRGLIGPIQLAEVFALLPRRFGVLRPLVDGRAEAGPESLMRLILRRLGCRVELQVYVPGIGRVDLIADGWLLVECDSRAHHSGTMQQVEDRRRDLAAAALGYTTIRILAEDILYRPADVVEAVRALLDSRYSG